MNIKTAIQNARAYLPNNRGAYARSLAGAIRSSMSDKAANAYRAAIKADGLEHLFVNLGSDCPLTNTEA